MQKESSEITVATVPNQESESPKKYKVNRCKAIIAMNLFALSNVIFAQNNKRTVSEKKVGAFDLIFIISACNAVLTGILLLLTRQSLAIPTGIRDTFSSRMFMGWLIVAFNVLGPALVPITVH